MTVIELPSRPGVAKPDAAAEQKRPTIATPVLTKEQLAKTLKEIDENVNLLYCVHDTLIGVPEEYAPTPAVDAVGVIYQRLRRLCDTMWMAM